MDVKLPEEVIMAWKDREGPVVLTTVSPSGLPNAIYASIVNTITDGRLAVVNNYFDKTIVNINSGSKASLLFITKGGKAYQVKGTIEYCTNGPLYNEMLTWADPKHPRKGMAIINTQEVYRGGEKLA
jgi:predicted pyridoxine 5'-phosphate oxidase superfamily flavin-nucleotide-binding protein